MNPVHSHVQRELERTVRRFNGALRLFSQEYAAPVVPTLLALSVSLLLNALYPSMLLFATYLCVSLTTVFCVLLFDERLASARFVYAAPALAALVAALHGEQERDGSQVSDTESALWRHVQERATAGDSAQDLIMQALTGLAVDALKEAEKTTQ